VESSRVFPYGRPVTSARRWLTRWFFPLSAPVIGPNELKDRLHKTGAMADRSVRFDRRGVSEAFALAVLVGMATLTIGAAGVYVLVSDETESVESSFEFQYFDDQGAVLITYAAGGELVAGNVEIEGPDNAVTWAEAANRPPDAAVGVGARVRLSSGNVYGSSIVSGDTLRIYRTGGANRTELTSWTVGN